MFRITDPLSTLTPAEAQRQLAGRLRALRLAAGFTQRTLASRAGVTLATLRRFERSGEVSLKYLMRLCNTLGRLDDFADVLRPPVAASMVELEARAAQPTRKRGTR